MNIWSPFTFCFVVFAKKCMWDRDTASEKGTILRPFRLKVSEEVEGDEE